MADSASDTAVHIAKGAEDIGARQDDEVSARLRSFDLQRHRTRERTLTSGAVVACVITALLVLAALYAATHRSSGGPVQAVTDAVE
jgi:hypothetical protein